MKKIYSMLLLLLVISCGRPGEDGYNGLNGFNGKNGADGKDSEFSYRVVNLESSCTVFTSPNCEMNLTLKSGSIGSDDFSVVVPPFIEMDNSPLQTSNLNGWITLKVGSLIYCYQRRNQNSTDPLLRTRHDLAGMKFSGNCSVGVDSTLIRNEITHADEGLGINMTVHGPFSTNLIMTTFTAKLNLELKIID